jgi:hypothetical protein
MTELKKIINHHQRILNGDAWHGQSVMEILEGINESMAMEYLVGGVHSILEIVLHITCWIRFAGQSLDGIPMPDAEGPVMDWPKPVSDFPGYWKAAVKSFVEEQQNLIEKMLILDDSILKKTVPGRDYDFYYLLHGIVQHNLYHAGQIAFIKSALLKK